MASLLNSVQKNLPKVCKLQKYDFVFVTKIPESDAMVCHRRYISLSIEYIYESIAGVGKTGVWLKADFQSGSRVLKQVF